MNGEMSKVPERIDMILQLLQQQREDQGKMNTVLGDLRVDVASVKKAVDGQQDGIAGIRADQVQIFDRLRIVEHQAQHVPRLQGELDDLDERVRLLEQDGAGHRVVTGAVTGSARELLRWSLGLAACAITGIVTWVLTRGH